MLTCSASLCSALIMKVSASALKAMWTAPAPVMTSTSSCRQKLTCCLFTVSTAGAQWLDYHVFGALMQTLDDSKRKLDCSELTAKHMVTLSSSMSPMSAYQLANRSPASGRDTASDFAQPSSLSSSVTAAQLIQTAIPSPALTAHEQNCRIPQLSR